MKLKKLALVVMSCCVFITSGNVVTYAYSDSDCKNAKQRCKNYKLKCKKGKTYRVMNEVGDILDGVGRGPEYLDHNDRIQRRTLYQEGKQDCEERDRQCSKAKLACSRYGKDQL